MLFIYMYIIIYVCKVLKIQNNILPYCLVLCSVEIELFYYVDQVQSATPFGSPKFSKRDNLIAWKKLLNIC